MFGWGEMTEPTLFELPPAEERAPAPATRPQEKLRNRVCMFGSPEEGEGPGQFIAPHGIAVDSKGDVYVSEVSFTYVDMVLPPHHPKVRSRGR